MSVRASLKALAIARSSEADDAMLAVYLNELQDLSPDHVRAACQRLAKLPRREFQSALPDVGTIRSEAAQVARDLQQADARRKLLPLPSDADPRTHVHCTGCGDTGWQLFRCHGQTGHRGLRDKDLRLMPCARRGQHVPHSYAEKCPCLDTNPVIAGRREWAAKRKAEREVA